MLAMERAGAAAPLHNLQMLWDASLDNEDTSMHTLSQTTAQVTLRAMIRRHPVASYTVGAYLFSWAIAVPLAAAAQGLLPFALPLWMHYLTAYGPMISALVVTAMLSGMTGVRVLTSRMWHWRIGGWWLAFAACSTVALYALIALVQYGLSGAAPDVQALGQANFLPYLGIGAWVLWIVTNGIGEETGWRGFALPYLQQRFTALGATLLLSLIWAGWHIPFFFYVPNFRAMGLAGFLLFVLSIMLAAIVFTWIYNSTNGSLLAVSLWHGGFNFITASAAGQGIVAAIMSSVVMVGAVVLVLVFGPANLAFSPKQIADDPHLTG